MIALLYKVIVGYFHRHHWEILNQGTWAYEGHVMGKWYDLQCTKCGTIKRKETGG